MSRLNDRLFAIDAHQPVVARPSALASALGPYSERYGGSRRGLVAIGGTAIAVLALLAATRTAAVRTSPSPAKATVGSAVGGDALREPISAFSDSTPRTAEQWNNDGVALIENGRVDEGVAALHRALELVPNHAIAARNLASVLERRGDRRGAIHYYQLFLATSPQGQEAAAVRQHLHLLQSADDS